MITPKLIGAWHTHRTSPRIKEVFFCPEARSADDQYAPKTHNVGKFKNGNIYITYGFNGYYQSANGRAIGLETVLFEGVVGGSTPTHSRPSANVRAPAATILFQDAWETMFDGAADTPLELSQWTAGPEYLNEYYRHKDRGNIMWADAHASQAWRGKTQWQEEWYVGRQLRTS